MRSSSICATRPVTAGDGGARTCSSGRSVRSNAATKMIGRFPGETSYLTLVWAVLSLYVTHATNGIKFTQLERQHLRRLRYEGHDDAVPEEVTAA